MNRVKADLEKFWLDTNQLLDKPQAKLAQHIARLKFNLKKDPEFKSWFDLELRGDFGDKMFDDLAEKLYSLVVQKRQYKFYINNLKLYSIPEPNTLFTYPSAPAPPTPRPALTNQEDQPVIPEPEKNYDMRYYNDLLTSIPAEYTSPAIILHCMIEQVLNTKK